MHLGIGLPMAGAWATPENQLRVARAAEDLGYHSLWVFQRLLYAVNPQNDYPPLPGQPWPKAFERVMDPIVSLWDIAALIPIIDEAGGRWTTVSGASDLNADSFVCTNGLLHDAVLAALA